MIKLSFQGYVEIQRRFQNENLVSHKKYRKKRPVPVTRDRPFGFKGRYESDKKRS